MTNNSFKTNISKEDLELYEQSITIPFKEKKFFKTYIETHFDDSVISEEDVCSLLFAGSVLHQNSKLAEYLLTTTSPASLFVNTNCYNFSAVSLLLQVGDQEILNLAYTFFFA